MWFAHETKGLAVPHGVYPLLKHKHFSGKISFWVNARKRTARLTLHVSLHRCQTAALWLWCPNRPHHTTSPPRPAYPAPPSADTVSQCRQIAPFRPLFWLWHWLPNSNNTYRILGNYGCVCRLIQQLIPCKCNLVVSRAHEKCFL